MLRDFGAKMKCLAIGDHVGNSPIYTVAAESPRGSAEQLSISDGVLMAAFSAAKCPAPFLALIGRISCGVTAAPLVFRGIGRCPEKGPLRQSDIGGVARSCGMGAIKWSVWGSAPSDPRCTRTTCRKVTACPRRDCQRLPTRLPSLKIT